MHSIGNENLKKMELRQHLGNTNTFWLDIADVSIWWSNVIWFWNKY